MKKMIEKGIRLFVYAFTIILFSCGSTDPVIEEKPAINPEDSNPLPKGTVKIMPIGDSLTSENTPGYRGYLFNQLIGDGYDIDFVGPNSNAPSNGGDPDHGGFAGYVIGPGTSNADSWASSGHGNIYYNLDEGSKILNREVDIILLMIGINDFLDTSDHSHYNPELVGAVRLDSLIEKIYTLKPKVRILVSNLTPVGWNMNNFAAKFNDDVPQIVKKHKQKGRLCYFVNVRNNFPWDVKKDIRDDMVHLTGDGYKKVADSYYLILKNILTVTK